MTIDAHFQPIFFKEVCPTEELAQSRRDLMAYYKAGRQDMERIIEINRTNGVDKAILMPFDYSTQYGDLITNDDVKRLVGESGGAFYGFASIDPHREDALQELEHAFRDLGLSGLKLHPSKQAFYPYDEKLYPIYELCARYNRPITFNAGISWQPDALGEYSRPIHFERVAHDFPTLRICLGHMGFPWVAETAMLLAKYPNLYTDTGALYFDSAYEFYDYLFNKAISVTWVDRSIRHQVLFATNFPRWHAKRTLKALKLLDLREETVELITGRNALEFLGEKEACWIS